MSALGIFIVVDCVRDGNRDIGCVCRGIGWGRGGNKVTDVGCAWVLALG